MKLCITKPDGSNAEIQFNDRPPSLDKVNSEHLFFENFFYKFIIRCEEAIDNAELFVGDYSVPLTYNVNSGCYETEKKLIFEGSFDLACVSINVDDGDGIEQVYYTDYLRIATTKQTARQVESMLAEIEENIPNFLDICFSRSRKRAGLIKNDARSIWNTLKIIDEIVNIYEENYGYFSNHKKSSVEQVVSIVDVKSMCKVDQESLIWIVGNPDNLVLGEEGALISVNGKNYMPSKIKTRVPQYSYDVYENRVILGFLKSVISYVDKQITGFNREIQELENIPESIVMQLPNTHELTGRCIFVYYKGVIERYTQRKNLLQEIYYRYERIFNCTPETLYASPKLTNTFKQVYHYRLCYECMVKWFEAGDYSFDHLNYLFKLKTLSRIFEYYCLIKLQNAIIRCGYTFVEGNRVTYEVEEDSEEINNQYTFVGKGQEIVLLYEPSIWVDKMNDGINLYSTGFNFVKCKWNNHWTPDFVIKIATSIKDYYYVLDAKYSNAQNVAKLYLSGLVLKYGAQIASKDKFFSDVIGIGAIYPGTVDKMNCFRKNGVESNKQALPNYFSLAIAGNEKGNNALGKRISELLHVVDLLEEEGKPLTRVSFVHENDKDRENALLGNGVSQITTVENTTDTVEIGPIEADNKMITSENVNGKRCFFYARGMCLCKKVRCNIVDEPCEKYIHRSSRKLLLEEDTCRNFIRYMRRGKIHKVECSVSGLPGCVGVEECKFCLKKKMVKHNE